MHSFLFAFNILCLFLLEIGRKENDGGLNSLEDSLFRLALVLLAFSTWFCFSPFAVWFYL
jgi:hypothetical protein